jgi:NAD(P)-dependent dehydrogenase (short-subunit alcohol dehydrogenase family)
LQDKHAIVTGGSRGIGKAIARELAHEGADVAIVARNKLDLEATARELAADVKYVGAPRCSRVVIPFMKEEGWGRFINISGGNARNAGNLSGGARNAALVHMTKTLAVQLGRHGITVNCIHPGTTRTERTPSTLAAGATQLGVSPEDAERAGLRSGLSAQQCHLTHGGRCGGRVRRGIPSLS